MVQKALAFSKDPSSVPVSGRLQVTPLPRGSAAAFFWPLLALYTPQTHTPSFKNSFKKN